eukprot:UN11718
MKNCQNIVIFSWNGEGGNVILTAFLCEVFF